MRTSWINVCLLGCLAACSRGESTSPSLPYAVGQALVIGSGDEPIITVVDDGCDSAECLAVREQCGARAYADVIVASGAVTNVICLGSDVEVTEAGSAEIAAATIDNGTLLILDGDDDGLDVTGDVSLSGNGAILHGASREASIVGGDLLVSGNNGIAREVTIRGDVVIDGNNATLAFVTVEGDVTIKGNNAVLAGCVVSGELRVTGNGATLAQNRVQGAAALDGRNLTCSDNVTFVDADADGSVEDTELGVELACPESKGKGKSEDEAVIGDAGAPEREGADRGDSAAGKERGRGADDDDQDDDDQDDDDQDDDDQDDDDQG